MKQISILGCGWLGFPLAKALFKKGFTLKGSTTSPEKLPLLENENIQPFLISLKAEEILGDITTFLKNSSILIIDIPPKLRSKETESFLKKIQQLIPLIEQSDVEKVLFISSTSVYGDAEEYVSEATIPAPETESGIQLLASEKLLQSNTSFQTTILRFGGLIGDDRHPVKLLAGKKGIENPEAPVNLIHQKDCIGIILKIIKTNSWNETFNAASPFHPSREDYYTEKAIQLGLEIPSFNHSKPSIKKIIDASKVMHTLDYTFLKL